MRHQPFDHFDDSDPAGTERLEPDLGDADILIIEDDREMRSLMETVLQANGCNAAAVASAIDGVDVLDQSGRSADGDFGLELVVLDWWLPGMTGEQFLEWLRDRDSLLPVLVISGFADEDLLDRAGRGGAAMLLSKPFAMPEFVRAVEALTAAPNIA